MVNAQSCLAFVQRLERNDSALRSVKRGNVDGLVDGRSPHRQYRLRSAGRAEACNVNWGTGRAFLESGNSALYDLTSQAPGSATLGLALAGIRQEKILEWEQIMVAEANQLFADDEDWDVDLQNSQNESILHGCGPLLFEDEFRVFPISIGAGDLKVPERTRSKTGRWEACAVFYDYYPPELYEFIRRQEPAEQVGWNVRYTEQLIAEAMDWHQSSGNYNWEEVANEIKTNSYTYFDDTKVCSMAHVFWREFGVADTPGRITHAVILRREPAATACQYAFLRVGRYAKFSDFIHPMYYDRGRAGFHHSVTGLGEKMFGALEWENRIYCNLADKTMAPKVIFRPTSNEAREKFSIVQHGDWGMVSAGYDVQQMPIQGFLTDGLAFARASGDLIRSNLSSYRQQVPPQTSGNPPTKFQKQLEAAQMSQLSNTTFNRYYKQLDSLYDQIVRRMFNPNSTDIRAQTVQEHCLARGVPRQAFGRIAWVKAVRVIGQGNPFMRKQAVDSLAPIAGSLPESGRLNWLRDKISCEAGQTAVQRYLPSESPGLATDQQFMAMLALGLAKDGITPPVTESQDGVTFATVFITACEQSINSLKQGADPMAVLRFLDAAGPFAFAQLARSKNDPLRKPIIDKLAEQLDQIASMTDQLKKIAGNISKARQEQQSKTVATLSDEQLAAMKAKGEEDRRNAKVVQQLQSHQATAEQHRQEAKQKLALADAETASRIHRSNLEAMQESTFGNGETVQNE